MILFQRVKRNGMIRMALIMIVLIILKVIAARNKYYLYKKNKNLRTDGAFYDNFEHTAQTACCGCGGGNCVTEWLKFFKNKILILIIFLVVNASKIFLIQLNA